jgi:regulator of replication initiation timing
MSEEKHSDNDPEKTLLTLDQLSQTIEVMTSVVNRLRQHLSEQLQAQAEAHAAELEQQLAAESATETAEPKPAREEQKADSGTANKGNNSSNASSESFVVEIKQQEAADPIRKTSKTLH